MHDGLFEAALGIAPPWFVAGVRFDEASKVLTVGIDFTAGSRFAVEGGGRRAPGARHGDQDLPTLKLLPA